MVFQQETMVNLQSIPVGKNWNMWTKIKKLYAHCMPKKLYNIYILVQI